jgi:MYXO-CTERM domain-containing protein
MKTRALSVLAVVGLASVANAQAIEGITYVIEWTNASISSGANTGAVYAILDPGVGTASAWNTPPGKGQAGTIKAFASSIFDTLSVSNGTNGTLAWAVPANMNLANIPGSSNGAGGITGSNAGQLGPPSNTAPVVDNKVKILDLTWTLNVAGNYTVQYAVKSTSGKVYLDVGLASWVGENAVRTDKGGSFNVTPAPASLALLGLGGLIVGRRRR